VSKEAWFRHFERLQAELPGLPDDQLAELARAEQLSEMTALDWADLQRKRRREETD
jgi:hypothetical protein